jgi:hypothetical protein
MSEGKTANDHTQAIGALREELDRMLAAEFYEEKDGKVIKREPRGTAVSAICLARSRLAELGPLVQQAFANSRR